MNTIRINGEDKTFDGAMPGTLAALLDHLGVDAATVVAEIDGHIIERAKFGATAITHGQQVELVRFVGGG